MARFTTTGAGGAGGAGGAAFDSTAFRAEDLVLVQEEIGHTIAGTARANIKHGDIKHGDGGITRERSV